MQLFMTDIIHVTKINLYFLLGRLEVYEEIVRIRLFRAFSGKDAGMVQEICVYIYNFIPTSSPFRPRSV